MSNQLNDHDAAFGSDRPHRGQGGQPGRGGFGHGGPRFPGRFGGPFNGIPGMNPRGFGPGFGPGGPRARRGDVRSAILGLLSEGPSNGYGLIKSIGEKTDGAWQPSPGSIYPTLAQLVDEGLIAQNEGARSAYELTDSGRAYVELHRDEIDAALRNAGAGREGDDLMTAVGKLMGVATQFRFGISPEQKSRAVKAIDELRRELHRILAE